MKRIAWTTAAACTLAVCISAAHDGRAAFHDAPDAAASRSVSEKQEHAPSQDWFRATDEEVIRRTLRFAAGGERTLDVRAIHGSIHVVGTDEADVQLEVRKMVRAESEEDVRAAARDVSLDILEDGANIETIVRETGNAICGEPSDGRTREWRRPRYRVTFDFAIRVPRSTRLRLCTINGGEILVEGTAGDFVVDNVNGRIVMENVRGAGSARTVNGHVTVSFREPPHATSLFKTINGDVVVTVPGSLSADLKMKTRRGGLFTNFDVQPVLQAAPVAERRNGTFVLRSNEFTLVRVGRGGPDMTLETFNGDVQVLRAAL